MRDQDILYEALIRADIYARMFIFSVNYAQVCAMNKMPNTLQALLEQQVNDARADLEKFLVNQLC